MLLPQSPEAFPPHQIREGVVSSIVNFGAFVDLGGVDGLIHVSELLQELVIWLTALVLQLPLLKRNVLNQA